MNSRLLALIFVIVCAALHPAFATLFTADQINQLSVQNMGLKAPLPMVEAGGANAIVIDLSQSHSGHWYSGTPIASVGWQTMPPGRYIFRLRAAVDSVGAANVSLWCEVKGAMPDKTQALLGWHRWLGTDFAKAGEFQTLETSVDTRDATMFQPIILWRRGTKEVGDIKQIKLASLEILPVQSLVITDVLANKVHYREGEAASGYAKVFNSSDAERTATLRLRLFGDLDTKGVVIYEKPVTLPARKEQQVSVDFPKLGKYGYEFRAELTDGSGKALDTRSDYFTVLNNFLEVGMSSDYPLREDAYWPYPFGFRGSDAEFAAFTKRADHWVDMMRRRMYNTQELFAWGPADCIKLVPKTEDWKCGQTKYALSVSRTKAFIASCHQRGITVQLYNQSLWGICDDGSYLQEHPEYFAYNAEGRPQGFNLYQPEPVDDHIAGLLASIKEFGWDGVRWDGHFDFTPPNDNLKTLFGEKIDTTKRDGMVADINDKIRKAINAQYPLFTWGYNWNDQVENFTSSREMVSICANGSWIMNEAIKDSENATSGTHKWKEYAGRINYGSRMVRAKGGLNLLVPPPQYFSSGSQHLYKSLLAFAGRSYLYGSAMSDRTPNFEETQFFVTRYARYIRGVEFLDMPNADKVVAVQSPREVWWKDYLTQKTGKENVEQVLGLVNPPAVAEVTPDPSGVLPAMQQNITVTFSAPAGMKQATAIWLTPDRRPFQEVLPVTMVKGAAQVTVPQLRFWSLVYVKWSK